ncbi:MAG: type IV secretory system conjugative DNA transfer family protein [Acidilobaceae archaeon]|nr:type IV secretory system conjugative DNA transfer family protein [Acidilobaceae archaeon]MCX8165688.1 type IV secretory system conjugative DNA transfer family protein [Acidilobaceae archaeon]MDW7974113.1 type IV secretory system conjugative DNA transfer family protein [Sulfolobales archaeon]
MNPIDLLVAALAIVSLFLVLRNMIVSGELRMPLGVRGSREMKIKIGGTSMKGYVLLAERLPAGDERVSERLVELAKSMRASATFVSSMIKVEAGRLLKYLDEEIKKAELAYTATKHVKYAERLRALQELYKRVVRDHKAYVGSLAVVLWVPEGPEEQRVVEAYRTLAEAELGVSLRPVEGDGSVSSLLAHLPPLETSLNVKPIVISENHIVDKRGVVVGKRVDGEDVVVLDWPRDFEAHMGVFGPTGRGKTVLLAGLSLQLGILSESRLDPYMVMIVDPKGDLKSLLSKAGARVVRVEECVPVPRLDGIAEELLRSSRETGWGRSSIRACEGSAVERGFVIYDLTDLPNEDRNVAASMLLSSLVVEASERQLPGRVVVVLDEAWRIAQGSAQHFTMVLREGRSKGVHVIYATQSPSDVPQAVLDNTRVMVAFGGFTRNYVELARRLGLESSDQLLRMPVGEALLKIGDNPPLPVSVYNYKAILSEGEREEVVKTA